MFGKLVTCTAGLLLAIALSCPVGAAELSPVRISAPVLGYVFDDTAKAIRKISGVPGAANVDAPLDLGSALQAAFVNSAGRLAIGVTKEGGVAAIRWSDAASTAQSVSLQTGLGMLTQAALSGTYAILTDGVAVEVWGNLTDQPGRVGQYPMSAAVVAVAINKDGSGAVATADGQVIGLSGGNVSLIASGGTWTAIAFSGADLLAADSSAGELVRFTDALHNPARSLVEKLSGPAVALAASRDGLSAAVAFTDDLAVVNLSGGVIAVECKCQSKGLGLLEGNLVIQLIGIGDKTLVLDSDAAEPRVIQLVGASAQ